MYSLFKEDLYYLNPSIFNKNDWKKLKIKKNDFIGKEYCSDLFLTELNSKRPDDDQDYGNSLLVPEKY